MNVGRRTSTPRGVLSTSSHYRTRVSMKIENRGIYLQVGTRPSNVLLVRVALLGLVVQRESDRLTLLGFGLDWFDASPSTRSLAMCPSYAACQAAHQRHTALRASQRRHRFPPLRPCFSPLLPLPCRPFGLEIGISSSQDMGWRLKNGQSGTQICYCARAEAGVMSGARRSAG